MGAAYPRPIRNSAHSRASAREREGSALVTSRHVRRRYPGSRATRHALRSGIVRASSPKCVRCRQGSRRGRRRDDHGIKRKRPRPARMERSGLVADRCRGVRTGLCTRRPWHLPVAGRGRPADTADRNRSAHRPGGLAGPSTPGVLLTTPDGLAGRVVDESPPPVVGFGGPGDLKPNRDPVDVVTGSVVVDAPADEP